MYNKINKNVNKNDEHPWGLKDVVMPIPLDFAVKLRNNTDNMLSAYRQFIYYRIFQSIPVFIQNNKELVYKKMFKNIDVKHIMLYKYQRDEQPPLSVVLNEFSGDRNTYFSSKSNILFLLPNLFNTAPISIKQNIVNNVIPKTDMKFTQSIYKSYADISNGWKLLDNVECWYSDDSLIGMLISMDAMDIIFNIKPDYAEEKSLFFENNHPNDEIIQFLVEMQEEYKDPYITYDLISSLEPFNSPIEADNDVVKFIQITYKNILNIKKSNDLELSQIKFNGCKYFINIGWYQCCSHKGAHAVSVIIDTRKKYFYVLDSNGVNDCVKTIYNYFVNKFNWKYDEYTIIPVGYTEKTSPISFQHIAIDSYCQTWNIFGQLLVAENDVGTDINDFILNQIVNHAQPITISDNRPRQDRLTIIMLEFMFYIYYEACNAEYKDWVLNTQTSNYNNELENYKASDEYITDMRRIMIRHYNNKIRKTSSTFTPVAQIYSHIKGDVNLYEKLEKPLIDEFKQKYDKIHNNLAEYVINPNTNQYISTAYSQQSVDKFDENNMNIVQFYDNILKLI
jgi:hypothetical protein